VADGKKLVAKATYTIGQPETLLDLLRPVLMVNPDIIYFAGSSSDVNVLINNINRLQNNVLITKPQIVGGSSLGRITQFPGSAPTNFNILHITIPAYPVIWDKPEFRDQIPHFFSEYSQIFGPGFLNGIPSYLPDKDIILSYDSTLVLLKGLEKVMTKDNNNFTAKDLGIVLATITNSYAVQGVSGQISFEPNGEPLNKAIEVLSFGTDGMVQVSSIFGNFLR
jgi:ABC-type branched-subunit amino acid transport system substrate-binding protein